MAKALLFLKAADNEASSLLGKVQSMAEKAYTAIEDCASTLQVMGSLEDDLLLNRSHPDHVADVTVQIKTRPGQPLAPALVVWEGLADQLGDCLKLERSMALVMREQRWMPLSPSSNPIYYHYLMVRREDFSPADFEDYYIHCHHRFGLITPAVDGYSQNMIDQASSSVLSRQLGLGGFYEVSGISELHIPDMNAFIGSAALQKIGPAAEEDEARFADRDASISYCSSVTLSLGDQSTIHHSVFL